MSKVYTHKEVLGPFGLIYIIFWPFGHFRLKKKKSINIRSLRSFALIVSFKNRVKECNAPRIITKFVGLGAGLLIMVKHQG